MSVCIVMLIFIYFPPRHINNGAILTLSDYEKEILRRMYDAELIGMRYKSIEMIMAKINWDGLVQTYQIKKNLRSIMRRLESKGFVSSRGKSGAVYSLTEIGVYYVKGR